jgi:hypothetical protein
MKRILIALALAVAYAVFRFAPIPSLPIPAPAPATATTFPEVTAAAKTMSAGDRSALAAAYLILSRSVEANPTIEPVFPDTAAVRRAHRAALLYVWAAVLGNKAGEVPGLREALESAIASRIGTEDIPLNPENQKEAAKAFADLAASLR